MKPNLFKYGTGELTHDAILSWILDWGNHKENELYNLANKFIRLLTGEEIIVENIEILQQYKYIDVLIKLNKDKIIVIEDKLDTKEHSNQLAEYKQIAEKEFKGKKKYYTYITVGDESDYDHVLEKGYKVIERKDLINLIKDFLGINDILDNYYNYLDDINKDYNSHKENDLDKWTARGWQGFYKELKKRFPQGGWGSVNNPRGEFFAFYWDFCDLRYQDKVDYTIYLQMEHYPTTKINRIAFKVEVIEADYQSEIRNYIWDNLRLIIDGYEKIRKVNFRKGRSMTFAEVADYPTKDELYNSIKLVEDVNRKLKMTLLRKMSGIFHSFNKVDSFYYCEDILVIDGIIPDEKIEKNLVLMANLQKNQIISFLKFNNVSKVFVFVDRQSLDKFKYSLLESKEHLDEGFNAHELNTFYSSKAGEIKILKYVSGIEKIKQIKDVICFINKNHINTLKEQLPNDGFYPYIIRDMEKSKGIEGYYIAKTFLCD